MQEHKYTLAQLAEHLALPMQGDSSVSVTRIAPIDAAEPGDLTFLHHPNYHKYLAATKASIVILGEREAPDFQGNALVASDPFEAYARCARLFEDETNILPGLHFSVIQGTACSIADSAVIGPNAVLGNHVKIAKGVRIGAGCVIGDYVEIGAESELFPRVTLYPKVEIGQRVRIHSGVVMGSDGFGLNKVDGAWVRIPQLGRVVIHDDVDIGANTTIDCGALGDTIIHRGVKLDNQIQIGHNVEIGEHTALAGCVGVAGSTKIGKHCMIGGASCIAGHIRIGDEVVITGMSQVTKSIVNPGVYSSGTSIQTNAEWHKSVARFKQLDSLARRINRFIKQRTDHKV